MKEQIIKLREDGKSYKEISEILKCSKSTVCYYLGKNQKDKTILRNKKFKKSLLNKKCHHFTYKIKECPTLYRSTKFFCNTRKKTSSKMLFSHNDVLNKFGEDTNCYLTGRPINLLKDKYHFDHIIPLSKGGTMEIDNLGITCSEANMAKSNLLKNDFLELCAEILKYNGYKVDKMATYTSGLSGGV
mgnify:FL=1|jgi:5-methylcytosine-specific restriction endonuclease McrA